jgi:hypothetical protein
MDPYRPAEFRKELSNHHMLALREARFHSKNILITFS